jgi:DNA-binding transcriptional LysR family regulator
VDLTQLRTFVAVAQEGRLTRAAERLHISQPAASSHVRALEDEFKVQLFARTNRGLELTHAGRQLAERAERVLGSAAELSSLARDFQGGLAGRLYLGSNADPTLNRMGPLVALLRERHRMLELNVEVRSSLATKQGVQAGELDGGFLLGSGFDKGLQGLVLASLEYRIAGCQRWADRVTNADWDALAALPWIVTASGTSNEEMRNQLFRQRGLEIDAAVEVNNDLLVRAFIAEGIGIGLVRRDLAEEGERRGQFVLSSLAICTTSLLFVYSQERAKDPLIRAVVEAVRTVWPV